MDEQKKGSIEDLKKSISEEERIIQEIGSLYGSLKIAKNPEEKKFIGIQINSLKKSLKKTDEEILRKLGKISVAKPLVQKKEVNVLPQKIPEVKNLKREKIPKELLGLEKETLKRLRKKEKKVVVRKVKKPSKYIKVSNRVFMKISKSLVEGKRFSSLKRDLIKANMAYVPASYISVILFTTLLGAIFSVFIFGFFLFFNLSPELPIITLSDENIGTRFLKVFWILFVIPIGVSLFMYFYPSMEHKSIQNKINRELPFATIHMSAISGSMIEPSKIFKIIRETEEYPHLSKEFSKLINEIHIYGYDLVSVLRGLAFNSPSPKLAELFNGLATTINSGGSLPEFFDKRAQSLLFEYRIEKEMRSKAAETFMDIYISVVIAAPMVFMLVLMMMKVSGLGIELSTSMISLIMILGVTMINIIFIAFLHLRQSGE